MKIVLILSLLLLGQCSDSVGSGKPDFTVSGTLYSSGRPLSGAEVSIDKALNFRVLTDPDGFFEISNVPGGLHSFHYSKTYPNGSFTEISDNLLVTSDIFLENLTLPNAVLLDTPTVTGPTSLQLSWTRSDADDFREYKIYQHASSGLDELTGTLAHVATVIDDTTFSATELSPNTTYFYRVYTMNNFGRLGGSNITSASTENTNLIWNGDFENGAEMTEWWSEVIGLTVEYSDSVVHAGNYSLHIVADSTLDSDGWIPGGRAFKFLTPINFPLISGRSYKLSGWLKLSGPVLGWPAPAWDNQSVGVFLRIDDLWSAINIGDYTDWSPTEIDWTYREHTFVVPDDFPNSWNTAWLHLGTVAQHAWFDDLSITLVD